MPRSKVLLGVFLVIGGGAPWLASAVSVWSEPVRVHEIRHNQDSRVAIVPDITPTADGCTQFRLYSGRGGLTRTDVKEMLAIVLTAVAIGGELQFRFDKTGSSACVVSRVRMLPP